MGKRQYQPIKITKRIDQASPQLLKALTQNAVVEAEFHFYRVKPTGSSSSSTPSRSSKPA